MRDTVEFYSYKWLLFGSKRNEITWVCWVRCFFFMCPAPDRWQTSGRYINLTWYIHVEGVCWIRVIQERKDLVTVDWGSVWKNVSASKIPSMSKKMERNYRGRQFNSVLRHVPFWRWRGEKLVIAAMIAQWLMIKQHKVTVSGNLTFFRTKKQRSVTGHVYLAVMSVLWVFDPI